MDPSSLIPTLLGIAVLLPLASFVVILCTARYLKEQAAWVAICAIGGACLLSFLSMLLWLGSNWPKGMEQGHSAGHSEASEAGATEPLQYFVSTEEEQDKESPAAADGETSSAAHAPTKPGPYTGDAVLPGGQPWIL